MPFITYTTVEGALTETKKQELSSALTNAVTQTLGGSIKPNVWVTLNEVREGSFYIGGHTLKAQTLKKLVNATESE